MLMSSSARPEGREENNPWRPHNDEIALTRGKYRPSRRWVVDVIVVAVVVGAVA